MKLLGLDIGMRRTGIAFADTQNGIPLPLETIVADSIHDMIDAVTLIVQGRKIDRIVVGLPLLPSGEEGSQAAYVRSCADALKEHGMVIDFLDERYTTQDSQNYDGDARAACELLLVALQKMG